ncbi:MAG: hypothetical protein CO171_02605 [Syntrophobacterales bacterium CG_4_9_14_3_um_filter_49_8]|nr:MAG: hypothetical protein CO171_02605 [Syntrophobacterales bacterium CG_4_9_14_3_um_filter_49_8]
MLNLLSIFIWIVPHISGKIHHNYSGFRIQESGFRSQDSGVRSQSEIGGIHFIQNSGALSS